MKRTMGIMLAMFALLLMSMPVLFPAIDVESAGGLPVFSFDARPSESSHVFDDAGLMDEYAKMRLDDYMKAFENDFDIEFIAVLVNSIDEDINTWTNRLFEKWEIGKSTKGNKGLLLVVVADQQKVRLEVGTDLEGIYTDAFVGYIEQEQMKPFFEEGRVGAGMEATLEMIIGKVYTHQAQGDYDVDATETVVLDHRSGGGGARRDVDLGSRTAPDKTPAAGDLKAKYQPQDDPYRTLELYLEASLAHVKDPDLDIYTDETKEFFRKWTVTNAQQDSERQFVGIPYKVDEKDGYAVIYFPDKDWTYNPFFLKRSPKGWQLDFATMTKVIQFNQTNYWRLVDFSHPYMFAFKPYKIDDGGFVWFKRTEGERGYLNISFPWGKVPMEIRLISRGSSAEKAGVRVGDVITHINGNDVRKVGFAAAVQSSVGPIGGTVDLRIYRPSTKETLDFTIERTEELP